MIERYMNEVSQIESTDLTSIRSWAELNNFDSIVVFVNRLLEQGDIGTNKFRYKKSILLLVRCVAGDESAKATIAQYVAENTIE